MITRPTDTRMRAPNWPSVNDTAAFGSGCTGLEMTTTSAGAAHILAT